MEFGEDAMTRGIKFLMAVGIGLGVAAVMTFCAGPRASPWLHTLANLGLLLNVAGAIWIYWAKLVPGHPPQATTCAA